MRVLHFDAFSGVSGDMTVAALLDLGVQLELLRERLTALALAGYELHVGAREAHGIRARKFDVVLTGVAHSHERGHGGHAAHEHAHRSFADIRALIEGSALPAAVRDRAVAIFALLAAAEGKVHGVAPDDVTFHEVGAIDSIVDVVATAIGVEELGVEHAYVGALPLGAGTVHSQHGELPVPAPATAELLRGFAVRVGDGVGELVTPTGAAIVAALARPGETLPPLSIERIGYGAGTRQLADRPNVLRLLLARTEDRPALDEVVLLETNIDDGNPEIYEYVFEQLFAAGARDVWLTPVLMKKSRPGAVLSVLGDAAARDALAAVVLRETSALGVRFRAVQRIVLPRQQIVVETEYGRVTVKIGRAPDGTVNAAPEYESCRAIARQRGVALKLVYRAALVAADAALRGL
jgi:uncharacterized protein (TIGR00299 family) protein